MLISVIIPVYNVKPFLEEAVESVIGQTYRDLEIIIVDDGSTDGSADICDKYVQIDSRIKVIHQTNKGLSAARNTGLDIMSGEFCTFLDSDDALHADALRRAFNAMQEHNYDIVEYRYARFETTSKMSFNKSISEPISGYAKEGLYTKQEALNLRINGKITTCVWNKMYKRKIWDRLRFCEGRNYEDLDIILRLLARAESVFVLDKTLVKYRKRQGSITSTNTLKNIKDRVWSQKQYIEDANSLLPENIKNESIKKITKNYYESLLANFFACSMMPNLKGCAFFLKEEINSIKKDVDIRMTGKKLQIKSFLYSFVPLVITISIYKLYKHYKNSNFKKIFIIRFTNKVFRKTGRIINKLEVHTKSALIGNRLPFYCPCCDIHLKNFVNLNFDKNPNTFDSVRYEHMDQDVCCPLCSSLPRHRILISWLANNEKWLKSAKILHFAQEKSIRIWLNRHDIKYVTADLYNEADLQINIEDTGLDSDLWDLIICNHVLEHVSDYKKALRELYRILSPDGKIIISFPVDTSLKSIYENDQITTREDRIEHFGQYDHLRVFGADSPAILESFGFKVSEINGVDFTKEIKPVIGPADYDYNVLWCLSK